MPDSFPVPVTATELTAPKRSGAVITATYRLASPAEDFQAVRTNLVTLGWQLEAGTSPAYNPDIASGTIIATGHGYRADVRVVDDEMTVTLTQG